MPKHPVFRSLVEAKKYLRLKLGHTEQFDVITGLIRFRAPDAPLDDTGAPTSKFSELVKTGRNWVIHDFSEGVSA